MARIDASSLVILLCVLLLLVHVIASARASDTDTLLKFKESLQPTAALASWNASTTPCSRGNKANWVGVRCQHEKIRAIRLENMGLKGAIDVDSLAKLTHLRTMSLMMNKFEGSLPEIKKMGALKSVFLSLNRFSGEIPADAFANMSSLKKVHLAYNHFSGSIPTSLTSLPRLFELRLEGNEFGGKIPDFRQTSLKYFNVSNNYLQGAIPASLSSIDTSSFDGNDGLCGKPLRKCDRPFSYWSTVVVALVVGVAILTIVAVVVILNHRKQPPLSMDAPSTIIQPKSVSHMEDVKVSQYSSDYSGYSRKIGGESTIKLSFVRDDREKFDMQELLRSTAEILGSGRFGSCYKTALVNGAVVVVKRFKQMNNVGKEEFHEHMMRVGKLRHRNLLPLVAYYYRKEEKLLVSDFVPNGSLAVHLHGHEGLGHSASLDWPTRLKIVKGVAKGLQYLYKELPSLITAHGHLKSSNILLGKSYEPLLIDYALVPVINQEYAQEFMVVYKSPEYFQNGRITKKTDLWCFGILILEILTGKFPNNFLQKGRGSSRSSSTSDDQEDLASWVKSIARTSEVFDEEMGSTRNSKGQMRRLLKIGLACSEPDVDKRWDWKKAIERIERLRVRDAEEML